MAEKLKVDLPELYRHATKGTRRLLAHYSNAANMPLLPIEIIRHFYNGDAGLNAAIDCLGKALEWLPNTRIWR